MKDQPDLDPVESQEWQEAIADVIDRDGPDRAHWLLDKAVQQARAAGAMLPFSATTPYQNTIPADDQPEFPGDLEMEWRIRTINRWNAMATVVRRNKESSEYGGHIASFASSAALYDVGLNHFWRARSAVHGGDLVFFQGHVIPGIYARSFMEGRISEAELTNFRSEVSGEGLSSYPHPWLMPDYWQFPTVSMGLGPLMAIYQARFMKYMHNRGLIDAADRKVWCFLGDGEMDEPESLGAISLAAREKLDNLIFVVNCNLQRLDGPVRGNSKIVQELEGAFRGAGWEVVKLLWGRGWDALLEKDVSGRLRQLMDETVDGDYQTFKSKDGAYIREHFFGKYPETAALVEDMSDAEIWDLRRGGHDVQKVFTAFKHATEVKGQPTCLLVKTVKGYGMGTAGEGQNTTHQQKKMAEDQLRVMRDRFRIPVSDEDLAKAPFVQLNNAQKAYLGDRRKALGGEFPKRHWRDAPKLEIPGLDKFEKELKGTGDREISTTMAFVRILTTLLRDKKIGKFVVPIVPDRVPHLRDGGAVPLRRHLQPSGPGLCAPGPGPDVVLQGKCGRSGASGRHQRGRRHGRLDRRGHQLFRSRRADDPVLYLLLDVRLPADRRPGLGGGRQPGARLHAGRHGGAHHAERRGPAARGWAQPHPGRHDPQLHQL